MSKNIGCRIVTGYKRPSAALVKRFENLPVANIDDCMNRLAAVHQDIRPMNKAKLLGTAFTVKVPQGDNLMFHKAMDLAMPGEVIVIDAGGMDNRAIFGELMINYCNGFSGLCPRYQSQWPLQEWSRRNRYHNLLWGADCTSW